MDVAFADTAVVSEVPVVVFVAYSPKLPALALLFVVVPTMPAVCDGVIVLVNAIAPLKVAGPASVPDNVAPAMVGVVSDGDVPNTARPLPVSSDSTPSNWAEVVAANCERFALVSAKVVPHDRPVPLVHFNALLAVLQLGAACATGAAVLPVGLANTVLAAWVARPVSGTACHVGDELGPLETMACPAVEPVGLSN
ncbi:hypothetical protein [Cupriavidus pinatubonensis]|uniref:hypothetical protein n=1 Tax=Cupriavidus pinatubonensis TaxID=248026 RepID=UPI003606A74A